MNCCVPFCKSRRKYVTRKYDPVIFKTTFHNFPADDSLRAKWIEAIRNGGPQSYFKSTSLFTWYPSKRWDFVCSRHFKPEDFIPCKKHKHLVPGTVPSIFPQSSGQKETSSKTIPTQKSEKRTNTGNEGKSSDADLQNIIESGSAEISVVDTSVPNDRTSETGNKNCSASVTDVAVNNADQTNVNPSSNVIANTNISYVGQVKINNSDKNPKNCKIFQCTIKPPDTNEVKPKNYIDTENSNNEDDDCTIVYPNNCNSSFNVNANNISTPPADQRMSNIDNWRASINTQIFELMRENEILRHRNCKWVEIVEKCQPKIKTKNEMLNQFNIEPMEKGIENKDVKSLFLGDQLRSLTRDQILWSESSLTFLRQLVKKFPESYDFLKQADVMYLPNPRALGCKKIKKC